jgi:hypothetical protein
MTSVCNTNILVCFVHELMFHFGKIIVCIFVHALNIAIGVQTVVIFVNSLYLISYILAGTDYWNKPVWYINI